MEIEVARLSILERNIEVGDEAETAVDQYRSAPISQSARLSRLQPSIDSLDREVFMLKIQYRLARCHGPLAHRDRELPCVIEIRIGCPSCDQYSAVEDEQVNSHKRRTETPHRNCLPTHNDFQGTDDTRRLLLFHMLHPTLR